MRWFFTGIALLVWPGVMWALDPQRAPREYTYAEWNTSHGLPYTAVRGLFQSSDGYLWTLTRGGLARFDGVRFTAFTHDNVPVLIDDETYGLADDAAGVMWLATNRGIIWYREGRWWRPPELASLDGVSVRWVERDGAAMWIGTATGVLRFEGGKLAPAPIPREVRFKALRSVSRGSNGEWVILAEPSWWISGTQAREIDDTDGNALSWVYSAVYHRDRGWWVGSDQGLYSMSGGVATRLPNLLGQPIASGRSLLIDRDENVWIGTRGELFRYTGKEIRLVERPGVDSIANFLCIYEDREGNLWGGTDSGLLRMGEVKVTNLTYLDGLQGRSVVSVVSARDDSIWVGIWGGGLAHLSPEGRLLRSYRRPDGLASDGVRNVTEGPDGSLWISYFNDRVGRLKDGVFFEINQPPYTANRLHDMEVDRDSTVWLSTFDYGLARIVDGKASPVSLDGVSQPTALLVDAQNRLWVSWATGFGRPDPRNGQWLERHDFGGSPGGIPTHMAQDAGGSIWIFRDGMTVHRLRDGKVDTVVFPNSVGRLTYSGLIVGNEIWINFRNGLARFSRKEFEAAAADPKHEVVFDFLREADGMRSVAPNVYTGQGSTVAHDGRLYFATSKGVAIVDPSRIRKVVAPPRVIIENLTIDKVPYVPGDAGRAPPGRGELEIDFTALGLSSAPLNRFRYRLLPLEPKWTEAGHRRVAYYGGLSPGAYRFELLAANADGVWSPAPAVAEFRLRPHFYETWYFYGLVALSVPLLIWVYVRRREAGFRAVQRQLEAGIAERTGELRVTNERLSAQVAETSAKAGELTRSEERYRKLNDELEARVAERTEELRAVNRELESFSYSVSHDLRAPLRGIDGWSLALMEDYGAKLDGKALGYLQHVRHESQRLGTLIDDLLKLARMTRTEFHRAGIDLSALAAETARRVSATRPGNTVEFVCAAGLRVEGDPVLLETALLNLLENAWKFSSKSAQPRVEFGRMTTESGPAFFVRDNGAGFDMRHAKNLFGVFQRMHTQQEFPGTGVGLATVQRVIQRHGGRVWADSKPGVQTTFYFTIPERH